MVHRRWKYPMVTYHHQCRQRLGWVHLVELFSNRIHRQEQNYHRRQLCCFQNILARSWMSKLAKHPRLNKLYLTIVETNSVKNTWLKASWQKGHARILWFTNLKINVNFSWYLTDFHTHISITTSHLKSWIVLTIHRHTNNRVH